MDELNKRIKDHNLYWLQTFEKIANNSAWESKYASLNSATYNFFSRRESVKKLIKHNNYELVLDLGCGTGEFYEMLIEFTKSYVGIDYSESMISRAKKKYGETKQKPEFIVASGENIPFDQDSFDMICAIGYVQYFVDPSNALKEISRVLKPGGSLIIQSFQNNPFKNLLNILFFHKILELLRLIYCKIKNKEYFKYSNKPYSKKELDSLLYDYGFELTDYDYSNYSVFPLAQYFSSLYINISEMIHKKYPNMFKLFAVNYNAHYVLKK